MIVLDGSPLVWGPRSVANIVRGWLAGWPADVPLRLVLPAGAKVSGDWPASRVIYADRAVRRPAGFRRRLAHLAPRTGADLFLAPWAAFPRSLPPSLPVVAMVHELPFGPDGALEGRARAWRHARWLRIGRRRGVTWITPSEATRRDLVARIPDVAPRVHVTAPGLDRAPWEAASRQPALPPYGVMVGLGHGRRGAFKKGLDVLLAAWARGAGSLARLVLVGASPRHLPPGVEATGPLEGPALCDLVAGASLLVYPSRSEGFGFPPLEAMAAGVPVVAAASGAIPETVGDAAWLVPSGDPVALAEGIARVSSDEALRQALVARGRERARQFSPAASARALLAVMGIARGAA